MRISLTPETAERIRGALALIVADHRNGVRNALWVIIGSVILFFGSQIIRMIHG